LVILCFPSIGAITPEVVPFSAVPASCLFRISLPGGGVIGSHDMSGCYFCRAWRLRVWPVVLVLVGGFRLLSFLPIAVVEFLCRGLLPRMRKLSLLPFLCGLRVSWVMHDGQVVQWP
jgi:hypothetical protein